MSEHRYLIAGARGGQGTTTVATVVAALAADHRPTTLFATRPGDVCALTGSIVPANWTSGLAITDTLTLATVEPDEDPPGPAASGGTVRVTTSVAVPEANRTADHAIEVVDAGRLDEIEAEAPDADTTRLLVVRGPCYLSLRQAVEQHWPADGVILFVERERSLGAADVADVLGVPVLAQVPVEAAVARTIDAGLLLARLHQTLAWRSLRRLVQDRLGPTEPHSVSGDNPTAGTSVGADHRLTVVPPTPDRHTLARPVTSTVHH